MTHDQPEAPEAPAIPALRNERGHFLPGGPGGPGRKPGLTHSEKVRALVEPHRVALVERALALTRSEDGNVANQALRILLERLAPAPRSEPERVEVPQLAHALTIEQKCEAVISAVGNGEISAESGERLLGMIGTLSRVVKLGEIERRLTAVEQGRTIEHIPYDNSDLV